MSSKESEIHYEIKKALAGMVNGIIEEGVPNLPFEYIPDVSAIKNDTLHFLEIETLRGYETKIDKIREVKKRLGAKSIVVIPDYYKTIDELWLWKQKRELSTTVGEDLEPLRPNGKYKTYEFPYRKADEEAGGWVKARKVMAGEKIGEFTQLKNWVQYVSGVQEEEYVDTVERYNIFVGINEYKGKRYIFMAKVTDKGFVGQFFMQTPELWVKSILALHKYIKEFPEMEKKLEAEIRGLYKLKESF